MSRKRKPPPPSKRELTLLPGIVDMVRRVSGSDRAVEVAISMAKAADEMAKDETSASQSERASQPRETPDFIRFKAWVAGQGSLPSVKAALAETATWEQQPNDRTVRRWLEKLRKPKG